MCATRSPQRFGLTVELLGMTTRGDQILDRALSKVGGKGLFVKELETALEDGRAHLAVHSLKDVPMDLPAGFVLAAVWEREDPRDAFVSSRYATWPTCRRARWWAPAACAAWCSCWRVRPDLRIEPLRGNLDTRLRKLDEGGYDAIVLAAAGLKRLGLAARIRSCFEPDQMIPAAGQGALGIEVREDATALRETAGADHPPAHLPGRARRARGVARTGRQLQHAAGRPRRLAGGQLVLTPRWAMPTQPRGRCCAPGQRGGDRRSQARALGAQAVAQLRAAGAASYLPARAGLSCAARKPCRAC
jgi:hydroxymethylbilane synthase